MLSPCRSGKPKFLQELLQVDNEAWSIDKYVQAAVALRSGRNRVAFSHCGEEPERVKSSWPGGAYSGASMYTIAARRASSAAVNELAQLGSDTPANRLFSPGEVCTGVCTA